MKVYGVKEYKAMGDMSALQEFELPTPTPAGHDLLVQVHAVATNPIDYKAMANLGNGEGPVPEDKAPVVPGWDAAGVVTAVGPDVTLYKVGDCVMFAGDIGRRGAFGEYAIVDERIVGRRPEKITWSQAAAIPLTFLTAWEVLFDRFYLSADDKEKNATKTILITGGAGGVASTAVEIAKNVLGLRVVATGSRPASIDYIQGLGADHVINHHEKLAPQLEKLGIDGVDYIFDTYGLTTELFNDFSEIVKGFGAIASTWPACEVDLLKLFWKSVNFCPLLMFTRPSLDDANRRRQGEILNTVADLVDQGILTSKEQLPSAEFSLQNLVAALEGQAEGKTIGKRTLTMSLE